MSTFLPPALSRPRFGILALVLGLIILIHLSTNSGHTKNLSSYSRFAANKWPVKFRLETGLSFNNSRCSKERDVLEQSPLAISNFIEGPPASSLRNNLKNDVHYITTWVNAGLTNEFMGIANMMYLAQLTERVAIIPPFAPEDHISWESGFVAFGDVFDLDRYRAEVRQRIAEWRDVKRPSEPYLPALDATDERGVPIEHPLKRKSVKPPKIPPNRQDQIGCWSTQHSDSSSPSHATTLLQQLNLDVSYTKVPLPVRWAPKETSNFHVVFWKMAALLFPPPLNSGASADWIESFSYRWQKDMQERGLTNQAGWAGIYPSRKGHRMVPDEHLACLDMSYFMTSGAREFEWVDAWAPAWRFVGKHLRFREGVLEVARRYLRRAFGIEDEGGIQPFIVVHIRRGDFKNICGSGDCFTTMVNYVRSVDEVKEELRSQKGLVVKRVVVASDEPVQNREFWDQIKNLGWTWIDHDSERTLERYGEWYLPIIDVAIQSLSIGFVGTRGSTFSLVSARRVEDWNNGIFRMAQDQK